MNYRTIYEYAPGISNAFHLIPIILFFIMSIVIIKYIKRTTNFSLHRQLILFFFYLIGGIASVIFVAFLIDTPKIISSEREVKAMLEKKNYSVVEGVTDNYRIEGEKKTHTESFSINNVFFKYTNSIDGDGFNQTAKDGGPIKGNGQFFRISYYTNDGENIILKIETKDL